MKCWITSQIGAREHYAIPRVLHRAGRLEHLYTDFWATAPWRLLGKMAGKGGLAARFHPQLKGAPVIGFNLQALKVGRAKHSNPYEGFLKVGEAFGRRVVKALDASSLAITHHPSPIPHIFFGYDTGFLEPARWVKARGGKTIVCQMDPSRFEVNLVREEEARWPGWSLRFAKVPETYFRRREEEWAVADLVMVNSEWTRQALMKQGVPESKLVVVPLAFEATQDEGRETRDDGYNSGFKFPVSGFSPKQPLRVLFLGQVILRKGIQYLIDAAKFLKEEPIRFDIVGPIGITEEALKSAPPNMIFHGSVTRDRTQEFYEGADLFVLPTLSDGFALTQLEAMARGLPVIATPNCGEVVGDGVDGLIVPAGDPMALAEAFQLLIQDPEKLRSMSEATKAKVEQFSLARLGENLAALTQRLG